MDLMIKKNTRKVRVLINIAAFILFIFSCVPPAAAVTDNLDITVKVPANTPESSRIYITGNHPLLGEWDAGKIEMKKTGDFEYNFSARADKDMKLEFKFTRGDFSKIEKSREGFEIPNRTMMVNSSASNRISCEVESWSDADMPAPGHGGTEPHITGKFKLLKDFKSSFLKKTRNVLVLLPKNYEEDKTSKYPVLYMHDGNNLFDPALSFQGAEWGVDETVDRLCREAKLKNIIVVGVYNTAERISEYTPVKDPKHGGGEGENYSKFIIRELKPYIDKNFRTLPEAGNTAIGGSSLGGLISLYIGLSHPEVFSSVIAMSPSIWWSNEDIINWVLTKNIDTVKTKIWMDIGAAEGEEAVSGADKLNGLLKKKYPGFKNYRYEKFPDAPHNESAWSARIEYPLIQMFGK